MERLVWSLETLEIWPSHQRASELRFEFLIFENIVTNTGRREAKISNNCGKGKDKRMSVE